MDGTYLSGPLYGATVERLVPVAGSGNVERIRSALGPLASHNLAVHLAHLAPSPIFGRVTADEVIHALGVVGNTWPKSIWGHVVLANFEEAEKRRALQ